MINLESVSFLMNAFKGGGPRNVYILSELLSNNGFESYIMNYNDVLGNSGGSRQEKQFSVNVIKSTGLLNGMNKMASFSDDVRFHSTPIFFFNQYFLKPKVLKKNKKMDIYISTFWQSVVPADRFSKNINAQHIFFTQADERTFGKGKMYNKICESVYNRNVVKVTQSLWLKQFLDETYGGLNEYIGIGIDHNIFKPMSNEKENTIFSIARPEPFKGFDVFLKACNILSKSSKNIKIVIAGDPDLIKRKMIELGFNFSYEAIGWIYDDKILAGLYSKSIFVNTGLEEALPMPPIEAMSCGSAVVLTDMPGAKEYAIDQVNCLLCQRGNPKDFADKIILLLEDENMRNRLSLNGLKAASKYNWDSTAQKLIHVIKRSDSLK